MHTVKKQTIDFENNAVQGLKSFVFIPTNLRMLVHSNHQSIFGSVMLHTLSLCLALIIIFTAPVAQANATVKTDYKAAKTDAIQSGKDVLLIFTASDYCESSQALEKKTLSREDFQKTLAKHFVIVRIDCPNGNAPGITDKIKADNQALSEAYQVIGYPQMYLCDAQGRPYAVTGYIENLEITYEAHILELSKIRSHRDEALLIVPKFEGVAKVHSLIKAINSMKLNSSIINRHYGDVLAQINTYDPKDTSGFTRKFTGDLCFQEYMDQKIELFLMGECEAARELIKKTLEVNALSAEQRQEIMINLVELLMHMKDYEEAIRTIQAAKLIMPENQRAVNFLNQCEHKITQARKSIPRQ